MITGAEEDLLAFYELPNEHWTKRRSTNPLERVNREIGRRTEVVGIFANDAALIRRAGALLIEQCDQWLVSRRHPSAESLGLTLEGQSEATTEVRQLQASCRPVQLPTIPYTTISDLTSDRATATVSTPAPLRPGPASAGREPVLRSVFLSRRRGPPVGERFVTDPFEVRK